ncbi:cytochrome P450 [Deinococcus yunweiensis]|uniref:cytochrome P450 n=1 Tax=Deinococcus yunweiensis TaxID=367282 RepID=UPI00398EF661
MARPAQHRPGNPSGLPAVRGLPVIGNLRDLNTVRLRPFLTQAYLEHGPVFRVSALGVNLTVLAGTEANVYVSREGHAVLRSREAWIANDRELGVAESLISADGPRHRAYRKVEGRAYARSHFAANLRPALRVVAEDLNMLSRGDRLPVAAWCKGVITEQLARIVVGGTARPYLEDLIRFVQTALMVNVTTQQPRLVLAHPAYRRAKARSFRMVGDLIDRHRADPPGQSGRAPDLIDDMLAAQAEQPELWTAEALTNAAMGAFIAGMDTAANSLAYTLYRAHRHPELLPPLLDEADALFSAGPPTAEALGRATYLHHFVMETLRLHPIAPALNRTLTTEVSFAGHALPAGTRVIIGTTVPHGLPTLYRNPERFDPGRFAPGRAEHRQPGAYAPFGVGTHVCAGSGMAEGLIMLNLAAALRTLDMTLDASYRLGEVARPTPSPNRHLTLQVRGVRHAPVSLLA